MDGSRDEDYVACTTVFPSDVVISMLLPDSSSICTAEVWTIIKALEHIQDFIAYIIGVRYNCVVECLLVVRWVIESIPLCRHIELFLFPSSPPQLV